MIINLWGSQSVPCEVALEYLTAWRDSLATQGLTLNTAKLQVWNPGDLHIPPQFREAFPEAEHTVSGFRVCGLPLDQADADDPHAYTPMGTGEFTRLFLEEARESTLRRLRVLSTFVHAMGPNTEALHVALRIARVNLQGRHVHLYRFCRRPAMHMWTATLDNDIRTWLGELLELPLVTPQAHVVFHTPVGLGGLGFFAPSA